MSGTLLHTGNIQVNLDKNPFQLQDSIIAASKNILRTQLHINYTYMGTPCSQGWPALLADAHRVFDESINIVRNILL